MKIKIKILGKEVEMSEKDLSEFKKFHESHLKDAKCYLSYENNELCFHEKFWLVKRFLHEGVLKE